MAQATIRTAGIRNVMGLQADARDLATYAAAVQAVPADLLLLAGVFGNISDADVQATITALPQLCSPGATVIWTRTRRAPDLTPAIRRWLAAAGLVEHSFHAPDGALFSVGVGPSVVGCKPRSRGARRRFNGAVNADDNAVLSTALQRVLLVVGAYLAMAVVSGVFAAVVTVVTLRVAGFHELDPAGTALWIGAAVLAWEIVTCLLWAAWHWRGSAGLGVFLRTGRSAQRQKRGRWLRVLWWTGDAVAVAAAVMGVLLLRFPDEPSAWWAAAEVLVVIKGLQAAMFWSLVAVNKAIDRGRERLERAQPPGNSELVPVEDILSRPDITGQHPYKRRHAAD